MDLTSEYFESVNLTISQPKAGYRYGAESLALANFCRVGRGQRLAELGSGVGVISLIIAARDAPAQVMAVEIQESLHRIARLNVDRNDLGDVVSCINDDYRRFARASRAAFDVVLANPPFYPAGSGRLSPHSQRAVARHELHGSLRDLISSAHLMLRPRGRLALISLQKRYEELVEAATSHGLFVSRLVKEVDGQENSGPLFLAELEKRF